MAPLAYLEIVSVEGTRIAALAPDNLDRQVPGCPDWQVSDLICHLGGVYEWATAALDGGGEPPETQSAERPEDPAALMAWFEDAHGKIVESLGGHSPEDPAWTFFRSGPQTAGWWLRRQAHETTIHRRDVEAAAGSPGPIDAAVASDGVDEFVSVFLARALKRRSVEGLRGSLHLHATDTPGEWWIDLDDEQSVARREHAKADTAIRGPAAGLNLWLWNRVGTEEAGLDVFGVAEVAASFGQLRI